VHHGQPRTLTRIRKRFVRVSVARKATLYWGLQAVLDQSACVSRTTPKQLQVTGGCLQASPQHLILVAHLLY
jgi:hypothetical protein